MLRHWLREAVVDGLTLVVQCARWVRCYLADRRADYVAPWWVAEQRLREEEGR